MSAVVAGDHLIRGIIWPESVYGVSVISQLHFIEHSGWVVLEDIFLFLLCRQGLIEAHGVAQRQAELEVVNDDVIGMNQQLRGDRKPPPGPSAIWNGPSAQAEAASRAKTGSF